MTTVVIPAKVSDLLEFELRNVMKRVVHELGKRYDFDRKEAFEFICDKYKMSIIPEEEERVRIMPVKPKKVLAHPVAQIIVDKTRCRARTYTKGVFTQCKRAWCSEHSQLCKMHERSAMKNGRVDDGEHPEEEVRKIKVLV